MTERALPYVARLEAFVMRFFRCPALHSGLERFGFLILPLAGVQMFKLRESKAAFGFEFHSGLKRVMIAF